MTEQEIMQLVEEAGMFALIGPLSHLLDHEIVCLQRFANLVAEREREACAELMERQHSCITNTAASAAIRARGEKENKHG